MLRPISSPDNLRHSKKPDVLHSPSPAPSTNHHLSLCDLSNSSPCKTFNNSITPASCFNKQQSWVQANQNLSPLRPSPQTNAKQTTTESLINPGTQRLSYNSTGLLSEVGSVPFASSSPYGEARDGKLHENTQTKKLQHVFLKVP